MFYQLHFNTRVNTVLLQSFLLSYGLTYGMENNHGKYFICSGYLCIKPCLLTHDCVRWAYPLVVLDAIYKLKLNNIVYGNALSLNWYGNASTTFSHRYSQGAWWFGYHLSTLFFTMMVSLWTTVLALIPD